MEDYAGDFEKTGKTSIVETEQKTKVSFKNIDDFENFINAIDQGYDSEDVIFTGCLCKLSTSGFN